MKRGLWVLVIVALALGGWWIMARQNTWRYKMTVEVQTPEGVRAGSAVREVTFHPGGGFWIAEGRPNWSVKGEAVVIDLPNGRTLYALLIGENTSGSYGAEIGRVGAGRDGRLTQAIELYPRAPDLQGFPRSSALPILVTFENDGDPSSAERVNPADLAAVFGPGVALNSIRIEPTDLPVTSGIFKRLPWLERYRNMSFAGNRYSKDNSIQDTLYSGAFTTGGTQ